jgi:hypothetical protein
MCSVIIQQLFEVIDGAFLGVLFRIEMLYQPAFICGVVVWLPGQDGDAPGVHQRGERLRRSRELTHFRSVRVTHLKNRISV